MSNDLNTLRDMFAAQAISGAATKEGASIAADTGHTERVAAKAYAIADAMLRARAEVPHDIKTLVQPGSGAPTALESE